MGDESQLTVRELLAEPTLGLRLVTDETAIDKAVRGIHLSDLRDPTPWMRPATVLLTLGAAFAADVEAGVHLVDKLAGIESPALGVATGHHIEQIPNELADHAERLKLAVFEVPYGVPPRTVVDYVYHALASTDLHRMRRLVAVQNHLLDLMTEERSAGELLEGVASLIGMPLTLFDSGGTVLAEAGEAAGPRTPDRLWRSYSAAKGGVGPLGMVESAHNRYYFREITMFGRAERVLASAVPHSADTEFAELALTFLQRLLSLDLLRLREELVTARRIRSRLLHDFLSGIDMAPEEIALRMDREGIGERDPWRLVLCEVAAPRSKRAPKSRINYESEDALIASTERFVAQQRIRWLGTITEAGLLILAVLPDREVAAVRELLTDLQQALQQSLKPSQLYEAQEAIRLARRQTGGVALFDDMRGRYRVIDGQSDETLDDIYERTVARLVETDAREHTRLLETLAVLLENQLAMQATADALYIHRNTLQKRVQRIERLLDMDLSNLDDVVELYLGLRAAELLGRSD